MIRITIITTVIFLIIGSDSVLFCQAYGVLDFARTRLDQPIGLSDKKDRVVKLASDLERLSRYYQENRNVKEFANQAGITLADDKIVATLFPEVGFTTSAIDETALVRSGVVITAKARSSMRVEIPIEQLDRVTGIAGIGEIRRPVKPKELAITNEGVALMNGDKWQSAGYQGAGVKIAVIDFGFNQLDEARGNSDIPPSYQSYDFTGTGLQTGSRHGTAVAEAVYDVAPQAQYYFYKVADVTDLEIAIDTCLSNGIHIVNHALGWFNVGGYYDGTGVVCDVARYASSRGIIWVNPAGNAATAHYRGTFKPDANNFHNYGDGANLNPLGPEPGHFWYHSPGEVINITLNWDNYPVTANDYDLYLVWWDGSSWVTVASSDRRQNGGTSPEEAITFINPYNNGMFGIVVKKYSATTNVDFTLFSQGRDPGYHTAANSLPDPATVTDVITVGAIDRFNYAAGPQQNFSSQGPTTDGRIKPDIMAPDNCNSFAYGYWQGTSLASSHITGLLAIIKSRFTQYTNSQVINYLYQECTVDLGVAGKDNVYGFGKAVMPPGMLFATPDAQDFGNVEVTNYFNKYCQLKNDGEIPVQITSLAIVGADAAHFSLVNPPVTPFSLNPGMGRFLTVRFSPTSTGFKEASLKVGNNSGNSGPVLHIGLTGTGIIILNHFTGIVPGTGRTQPIYVIEATVAGASAQKGDEIGIFDGTLLVGASKVFSLPMLDPIIAYLEYAPPGQAALAGAKDGNPISFKIWKSNNLEVDAVITEQVTGSAEFQEGAISAVKISDRFNLPPRVANPVADVVLNEDDPGLVIADLDTVFLDPNSADVLTYSAVMNVTNITLSINPDNIITLAPAPDWFGNAELRLFATDPAGETAIDTVQVTVNPVNDPPVVLKPLDDISMSEDDPNRIAADLTQVFYDVDNETLNYSTATSTTHVTISLNETKEAIIALASNWHGLAQIIFTASDMQYAVRDTISLTVRPVNDPPILVNPINDLTITENAPDTLLTDLAINFMDVDGDSLVYQHSVDNENVMITIAAFSVIISVAPGWHGTATAIFTASDDEFFVHDTVLITVNPLDFDPTAPVILLPEIGTELSPEGYLQWTLYTKNDGQARFHVQLDDSSTFSNPEIDQTEIGSNTVGPQRKAAFCDLAQDSIFSIRLSDFYQFDNLLDNTEYYWRVRAIFDNGITHWSGGKPYFFFNRLNNPPNPVVSGFSPADNLIVTTLAPTITWDAATDPDLSDSTNTISYSVQLSHSSSFAEILSEPRTDPGVTTVTVDPLVDNTRYYYRIRAHDDENDGSDWSNTQSFIVDLKPEPPAAFNLLRPCQNAVRTLAPGQLTDTITFVWESAKDPDLGDYVAGYILAYCQDSTVLRAFSTMDTTSMGWFRTGIDTTATVVLQTGTYYWRVYAYDTHALYSVSPDLEQSAWKVTIAATTGVVENEKIPQSYLLLQNYPNPFNPETTITFGLPEPSEVTLSVINLTGRNEVQLFKGRKSAGYHSVVWHATTSPSGTYFIKMQAGDIVQVKKCILLK